MKLLFCIKCSQVFSLSYEEKQCACGEVKGKYIDRLNAEYSGGYAVPLGFANLSFSAAVNSRPPDGQGRTFNAFVIPEKCDTFKKIDRLG